MKTRTAILLLGAAWAVGTYAPAPPINWTHALTPTCMWAPRPWAEALGAVDKLSDRRQPGVYECRHARGQMTRSLVLNHIEAKWPSKAQLAAWERDDAKSVILPPEPVPLRP